MAGDEGRAGRHPGAESSVTGIAARLAGRIRSGGPISLAAFMTEALFDPREGFYATRNPIGAGEDFITAPVISQMFGELVGLWTAQSWMEMGRPTPFNLIELGPGTGVLMADALRAGRAVPGFCDAVQVILVEASAALKAVQARNLAATTAPVRWAPSLDAAPPGPAIVIGNEFLDCLAVRQAVKQGGVWRERLVGLHPEDGAQFAFVLGAPLGADIGLVPERLRDAPEGALVELRPGDLQIVSALADRFAAAPGRALFIDYGPARSETGDTLQAIRGHEKTDPLAGPGSADLTARVDFESLVAGARKAGLDAHGPVEQGPFLVRLGIERRAAALLRAHPDRKETLARQLWRLTDPGQMGALFKAVCLSGPGLPAPAGFNAHG